MPDEWSHPPSSPLNRTSLGVTKEELFPESCLFSKTLFFLFLFSHRDRPAASYYFHIWRLFHYRFPEKLKTLLDIEGATCWTVPVSTYWERSWPLTLASVTAGDNNNSKHSQRTVDSKGFRCSHLISPTPPAQDRRPTAADEVSKSQRHPGAPLRGQRGVRGWAGAAQ